MDIEGADYQVILNASSELLNHFRILVIEFHFLDKLFDPLMFGIISSCFEKLLESFYVAHIHPNNFYGSVRRGGITIPRIMEFTFLNRKRVASTAPMRIFPHPLDAPNVRHRKNLFLPKCWYTSA